MIRTQALISVVACALGGLVLVVIACAGSDSPSPSPTPSPSGSGGRYFPDGAPWYQDVSTAALDRESAAVIAYLDRVGFGLGRLQIDYSLEVVEAPADTPLQPFETTDDFFTPGRDPHPR